MPYPSSERALAVADVRRRGRRLGVVPAALVPATTALVNSLVSSLGPSHQAQNIQSNKYKFDDLGQFAVQNPYGNYQAITGLDPNRRTPTSKSALAWLTQIVNGPGFQGGPGTPFPDNPRDFLIWADKHDAGIVEEWNYAHEVLTRTQQVLAGGAAGPSSGTIPGTNVPWSALPATVATGLQQLTSGTLVSGTIPALPQNLPGGPAPATSHASILGMSPSQFLMAGALVGFLLLKPRRRF